MKVDPTYERNLEIHLHGPGPSDVPATVLKAISAFVNLVLEFG